MLVLGGCLFIYLTAQDAAADGDDWRFSLMPVIWVAGVDVDTTTVKGRSASGDFGPDEVMDHLDMGLNLQMEVWRGPWGLLLEELYLDLGLETDFSPRIGPKLDADLDLRLNLFEMAAAYQLDRHSTGASGRTGRSGRKGNLILIPMAGLRYGTLSQKIDLNLSSDRLPGVGERASTYEDSDWWLEVFAGGRLTYWVGHHWAVTLRADVGGISYQEERVFSWKLVPSLTYRPLNALSIVAGYKIYDFNYEEGSGEDAFELDALLHGPTLTIMVHF
jgi:hypothetical protein